MPKTGLLLLLNQGVNKDTAGKPAKIITPVKRENARFSVGTTLTSCGTNIVISKTGEGQYGITGNGSNPFMWWGETFDTLEALIQYYVDQNSYRPVKGRWEFTRTGDNPIKKGCHDIFEGRVYRCPKSKNEFVITRSRKNAGRYGAAYARLGPEKGIEWYPDPFQPDPSSVAFLHDRLELTYITGNWKFIKT